MVDFLSNKKERVMMGGRRGGEGRGIACSVLCVQAIVPGEVPMRNWGKPKFLNGQQNGHNGLHRTCSTRK